MNNDHEHLWTIESSHATSEGMIAYQHCACGARRVVRATVETIVTR